MPCHKALYDLYRQTPMGRSMSPAVEHVRLAPAKVNVSSEPLKREFSVWTEKGVLHQSEASQQFQSEHQLAYAIGSGTNGLSFLVKRSDHLFQAPLSYYSRARSWALSPGYEHVDLGFNRPIASACLACHSGRMQPIANGNGQYAEPPFRELAIGCENCHGPGQMHVRSGGARRAIVNPARLSPSLAEDICMYCHQGGDTRIVQPGRAIQDFRPGQVLNDTVAIFKIPRSRESSGDLDLLEHHESMRVSRCYTASNANLNCITCHSPHRAKADYRATCLSCHKQAFASSHPPRTSDCIGCHMPKRPVGFIAHSALTNHRIVRTPEAALPEAAYARSSPGLPDLVHFNRTGKPLPLLTLLQAYGELLEKNPEYYERFQSVLDRAAVAEPVSPLVLASLGRRALRGSQTDQAITLLTNALKHGSDTSTTFEDLGEALSRAGRLEEAVKILEQGISIAPYTPVLYKSLALRLIKLQRYPDAKRTLERYVELFPEDDFVRKLLAQVSGPG